MKQYYCFTCEQKMDGECDAGGCFYFCVNQSCARYGLYSSCNIDIKKSSEMKEEIKRIVFLNTAILTSIGSYEYEIETIDHLKNFLKSNPKIEQLSAIGHQSTANILTELFGFNIPLNRIQYRQEIGDYCIVFKLNGRPEEGKILSREDIEKIGYEFYVLKKVS